MSIIIIEIIKFLLHRINRRGFFFNFKRTNNSSIRQISFSSRRVQDLLVVILVLERIIVILVRLMVEHVLKIVHVWLDWRLLTR
jgi:hypothetical protein